MGDDASSRVAAGIPVMLGARAIGPADGSTVIGGLVVVACGVDSSIGEHAPSHSGMAPMIAVDLITRFGQTLRLGFFLSTIARSPIQALVSPALSRREISLYLSRREQRASAGVSGISCAAGRFN